MTRLEKAQESLSGYGRVEGWKGKRAPPARIALRWQGATQPPPVHRVPSTSDFHAAIRHGLGWGMVPSLQATSDLVVGRLERLSDDVVDVPLHWQR